MTVPEQLIQIVLISKNGSTPLTNVRAAAKAGRNLVVADGDVTDRTGLVAWPEPSWDRANSNIGRSCQATWATVCFRASNWALAVLPSRTETLRVGPSSNAVAHVCPRRPRREFRWEPSTVFAYRPHAFSIFASVRFYRLRTREPSSARHDSMQDVLRISIPRGRRRRRIEWCQVETGLPCDPTATPNGNAACICPVGVTASHVVLRKREAEAGDRRTLRVRRIRGTDRCGGDVHGSDRA